MAKKAKKKKTGGRKKGTPNNNSLNAKKLAEELGVDPLEILLHFATGNAKALGIDEKQTVVSYGKKIKIPAIPPELRLKAAKEACPYIYPQRKAIEFEDENGDKTPPVFNIIRVAPKKEKKKK